MLALDAASTDFFKTGRYELEGKGNDLGNAGRAAFRERFLTFIFDIRFHNISHRRSHHDAGRMTK